MRLLFIGILLISICSCQLKPETGNVVFWYNSHGTNCTVYIDGNKFGVITQAYTTYNPDCGATGCANFTLNVGLHSYVAKSAWHTWQGDLALGKGCTKILLQ